MIAALLGNTAPAASGERKYSKIMDPRRPSGAMPIHQLSSTSTASNEDPAPTAKSATVAVPADGVGDGPLPMSSVVTGHGAELSSLTDRLSHSRPDNAIQSGTVMPVSEPLMRPPYAAHAMPYPPFACSTRVGVPSVDAASWNRPLAAAATTMNFPLHPVQMMMYQHQQQYPAHFFFGQHNQYQQDVIDSTAANSNGYSLPGNERARDNVADGVGSGAEVANEFEPEDGELDELNPSQDTQEETSNIMDSSFQYIHNFDQEFSPRQLVLKGCASSPCRDASTFDINLMDFWSGEPIGKVSTIMSSINLDWSLTVWYA